MILTVEDWGGEFPETWTAKSKGVAIDRALRRQTQSTSWIMEPYDLDLVVPDRIRYHDFKSTSTGSISISRMEFEFAQRKYFTEKWDTLYWVISQGQTRDEYEIEYYIRFSRLYYANKFRDSHQPNGGVYFWMDACRPLGF